MLKKWDENQIGGANYLNCELRIANYVVEKYLCICKYFSVIYCIYLIINYLIIFIGFL
jgi:hypothetical protein